MKKRIAVCCISSVLCHILFKPRTSGCQRKEEVMLNKVYSEKTTENKDGGGEGKTGIIVQKLVPLSLYMFRKC